MALFARVLRRQECKKDLDDGLRLHLAQLVDPSLEDTQPGPVTAMFCLRFFSECFLEQNRTKGRQNSSDNTVNTNQSRCSCCLCLQHHHC